jgi:hypothetical protein
VRVTLSGEIGPDVDLNLDDLNSGALHVDGGGQSGSQLVVVARLGRVSVGYDLEALSDERTVRGQFVRDVRAATDLTDDQRRKVLTTGLRALDGRQDLEVR